MSSIRTKAIVIRRTAYGEADRIVQFLTPNQGKISVMARGVRREKSKLAGGIELFARCDITVSTGRGELGILTSARLEQFYSSIIRDIDRLTFGYEVLKQIAKAADALDEPAFFDLTGEVFQHLNDETIPPVVVKTWFWLQLAILLGVGLNLSTDDNGMKLVEDASYGFDEQQSVFMYRENGRFTSDHVKILRILSAQSPKVAMNVKGLDALVDDCLWLAERTVAH